jgi:hypothetical protein
MYNCPKCDYGTNVPVEFRNHLKEQHPDIENPDLAYLHAGKEWKLESIHALTGLTAFSTVLRVLFLEFCDFLPWDPVLMESVSGPVWGFILLLPHSAFKEALSPVF